MAGREKTSRSGLNATESEIGGSVRFSPAMEQYFSAHDLPRKFDWFVPTFGRGLVVKDGAWQPTRQRLAYAILYADLRFREPRQRRLHRSALRAVSAGSSLPG